MKPPSKAQLWARERNWNKARLTGIIGILKNINSQKSTVVTEQKDFDFIIKYLTLRLDNRKDYNKESKKKFLKD